MDRIVYKKSDNIDDDDDDDRMYPIYFGVSCAFLALKVLGKPHVEVEKNLTRIVETMLQGSTQLLGLIVWKVQKEVINGGEQKLKSAEMEIENLKKIRHEDAKANEKVVGIFAAQEQSWFSERRKLRQQIGALLNELRVFEKKRDLAISELNQKLKEMEGLVEEKDKKIEEEEKKRKELEEKAKKAEKDAEDLRESAKREGQEHSSDLRKHKTAFIELVSNQRHLEAELGRAVKHLDATKEELISVMENKEESDLMVQKLTLEIAKFHKDLEQKDKILSAMLRKSKLDTAEKQMLLKEVKLSKARRKHAENETEKWREASEGKHDRHSFKNMLLNLSSRKDAFPSARGMQHSSSTGSSHISNEKEQFSPISDHYLPQRNEDLSIPANAKRLEDWVRAETERYATLIEQRHHIELDAFAEQMRIKDEKLEAFRWQLLRTELETKQLQSHLEGLVKDVTQLRHDKMKLESLLLEREDEINSLKDQFASKLRPLNCFRNNSNLSPQSSEITQDPVWSRVKIVKRKPGEKQLEMTETLTDEVCEKEVQPLNHDQFDNAKSQVQSPENKIEEEKHVCREDNPTPVQYQSPNHIEIDAAENIGSTSKPFNDAKQFQWKMDLHALGVSYKIKRLKQQLILIERLTGMQNNDENAEISEDSKVGMKAYLSLITLLNKQIGRYQSLQEKTNDLCKRMQENVLYANRGELNNARKKEKTSTLEHFLEETFQLQRYIVATGQKLFEIQSKIVSGFVGVAEEMEKSAGIDMKRFSDSIRNLFHEVQRGLEVRTARIIGDLEGTLAREGMICLRRNDPISLEGICGLIIYKLFKCLSHKIITKIFKCFLYDDDVLDIEASDSTLLFSLANRLQNLFGGKVFVGLRIPDADSSSPQTIDLVLLTKRELRVISVKNFSGILTVQGDGSWACEKPGKHNKVDRHPDPVEEVRKQASILQSYLEQRGAVLPREFLTCKIILPNPNLCTIPAGHFPPEVVTHEQLVQLKLGTKSVLSSIKNKIKKRLLSSWVKSALLSWKKDRKESSNQNLEFVLSTSPIWDRLELKGSNYVLGEFLEFKGKKEDVEALRHIRRSKVGQVIIQKTSMFGLAPPTLQVLYTLRDYRTKGASAPEWKEVTVRSSNEIIFQVKNASKSRKFKLSSVCSMHLSA